jgi:3',5'-cyclic AMP phosphodiesterase CpdA
MDENTAASATAGSATRRGVLKCLAWAGTGILWTVAGGVPKGIELGLAGEAVAAPMQGFTFVQVSDSHIGFRAAPNPDPVATLKEALARIGKLPARPAMMIHTGDVSHLSKPAEFDTAAQTLEEAGLEIHFIPGEHDVIGDDGKEFFSRFGGKGRTSGGWYSFDLGGVHFIALVNVVGFTPGTGGKLGPEQLEWLEKDLAGLSASTPIVAMAHIPMWPLYPKWGWATADAPAALQYLKRFGSVTVLNGHIHQIAQKVEGNLTFRTAMSTAFPQPAAGQGPGPGPLQVPADRLKHMLGLRRIEYAPANDLALTDVTLS